MILNCLIIDDEPSSQNVLKQFINKVDFLSLKSTCNNAIEAMEFLKSNEVDVLFLDINMPHISGLNFYKSLHNPPLVIFTTAYSEYALEGFEVNATDYLLKPFSFERFFNAVVKARETKINTSTTDFIIVKADKKIYKISLNSILFIEAMGDYLKIHLENKTIITYKTLKSIKNSLPFNNFIQVHKSFIINKQKMDFIEGNQLIIENAKIPIGQKYKADFLKQITQ